MSYLPRASDVLFAARCEDMCIKRSTCMHGEESLRGLGCYHSLCCCMCPLETCITIDRTQSYIISAAAAILRLPSCCCYCVTCKHRLPKRWLLWAGVLVLAYEYMLHMSCSAVSPATQDPLQSAQSTPQKLLLRVLLPKANRNQLPTHV